MMKVPTLSWYVNAYNSFIHSGDLWLKYKDQFCENNHTMFLNGLMHYKHFTTLFYYKPGTIYL